MKLNLDVDLLTLPEDLSSQSSQYGKVGEEWADADMERDKVRARLDKKIRTAFRKENEKEPTEAYIKNQIDIDEDYIEASHTVHKLDRQLKALEERGRSLAGMIKLYVTETYFDLKSGNISPELRKKYKAMKADEDQKENLEKTAVKMKKRKKKK